MHPVQVEEGLRQVRWPRSGEEQQPAAPYRGHLSPKPVRLTPDDSPPDPGSLWHGLVHSHQGHQVLNWSFSSLTSSSSSRVLRTVDNFASTRSHGRRRKNNNCKKMKRRLHESVFNSLPMLSTWDLTMWRSKSDIPLNIGDVGDKRQCRQRRRRRRQSRSKSGKKV